MEEKTYKAYEILGDNGIFVYTGNQTYTIDVIDTVFNTHERYTITNALNRRSAIAFVAYINCGCVYFVNSFDRKLLLDRV